MGIVRNKIYWLHLITVSILIRIVKGQARGTRRDRTEQQQLKSTINNQQSISMNEHPALRRQCTDDAPSMQGGRDTAQKECMH